MCALFGGSTVYHITQNVPHLYHIAMVKIWVKARARCLLHHKPAGVDVTYVSPWQQEAIYGHIAHLTHCHRDVHTFCYDTGTALIVHGTHSVVLYLCLGGMQSLVHRAPLDETMLTLSSTVILTVKWCL